MTVDPKAVTYVLNHPIEYEKPAITQTLLSSLIGPGTSRYTHKTHEQTLNLIYFIGLLASEGKL